MGQVDWQCGDAICMLHCITGRTIGGGSSQVIPALYQMGNMMKINRSDEYEEVQTLFVLREDAMLSSSSHAEGHDERGL